MRALGRRSGEATGVILRLADLELNTVPYEAARADKLPTRDTLDAQRVPPGYTVLHLRSGWNISRNFTAKAAIENVLDTGYRVHGSGQNMAGRNFIMELTARF